MVIRLKLTSNIAEQDCCFEMNVWNVGKFQPHISLPIHVEIEQHYHEKLSKVIFPKKSNIEHPYVCQDLE